MTHIPDIIALLSVASLRKTRPRIRILETLFAAQAPMTVEEVHAASHAARCDMVTVYRCLEKLEKAGIVRRLFRPPGIILYAARTGAEPIFIFDKDTDSTTPLDEGDIGRIRMLSQRVSDHLTRQGYRDVIPLIQFFVSRGEPKAPAGADLTTKPRKRRRAAERTLYPRPTIAELRRELESSASLYPSPCTEREFLAKVSQVFARPGTLESLSALGSIHMWGFYIRDGRARGRQQRLLTDIRKSLAELALTRQV